MLLGVIIKSSFYCVLYCLSIINAHYSELEDKHDDFKL